jgi:hypothetical protein
VTVVNVVLTRPQGVPANLPVTGWLQWTPTTVQTLTGAELVLPVPLDTVLTPEPLVVDITPTGQQWCWRVDYRVSGYRNATEYVAVPMSGPVNFADLARVDPATLEPTAAPAPAWYAYVDNVVAAVGSQASLDGGGASSTYDGQFNFDGGTA